MERGAGGEVKRPPQRASIPPSPFMERGAGGEVKRPPQRASIPPSPFMERGAGGVRSNARRSGRLPPRHLWRGGGRQAGGEVPIHFSCEDLDLVKALRIQYKVAPVHFWGKLECT